MHVVTIEKALRGIVATPIAIYVRIFSGPANGSVQPRKVSK